MEYSHPLSRMAAVVATLREQGQTLRLVLRNTERFGVLHLYFERGHLVSVQGHKDSPDKSFVDLATWNQGSIRQDDLPSGMENSVPNPALERMLDVALEQLEERGIVQAMPIASPPSSYPLQPSPYTPPSPPRGTPPYFGGNEEQGWSPPYTSNIAPLEPQMPYGMGTPAPYHQEPPSHELFSNMQTIPIATTNPADYLGDSQWQLLALVVRQVVEQAGVVIGKDAADGFIRQSLAYGAVKRPPLRMLEIDATGWLSPLPGQRMANYPLADVADSIAILLTSFENRCGNLIGGEEAHRIIVTAARPFSASLAQLGLAIAV